MKSIRTRWKERVQKIRLKKSTNKALEALIEQSTLKERFLVMNGLSGVVATCGVLLQDTSILIAAMVLAPLLTPLLAIGAGVALSHRRLILFALRAFMSGFLVVAAIAAGLTFLLQYMGMSADSGLFLLRFRQAYTLPILMIVSGVSGFGAIYSWLKNATQANFVGLAIAVALVPFVALIGILVSTEQWSLIPFVAVILAANLFMIVAGAVAAFLLLGLEVEEDDVTQTLDQHS